MVGQEPHASLGPGEYSVIIQQEKSCKRYLVEEVPNVGHVLWKAISYGSHVPRGAVFSESCVPTKPCPKAAIFLWEPCCESVFPEGNGLLAT